MRPSLSTTGVKFSEIPNFLKVMVGVQVPLVQLMPDGIGNSPPARKVALSPEIAVRLGSASVRTTPALSMARMVAVTAGTVPLEVSVCPNEPVAVLPATRGRPYAVNGLVLLKFTTAVP